MRFNLVSINKNVVKFIIIIGAFKHAVRYIFLSIALPLAPEGGNGQLIKRMPLPSLTHTKRDY